MKPTKSAGLSRNARMLFEDIENFYKQNPSRKTVSKAEGFVLLSDLFILQLDLSLEGTVLIKLFCQSTGIRPIVLKGPRKQFNIASRRYQVAETKEFCLGVLTP